MKALWGHHLLQTLLLLFLGAMVCMWLNLIHDQNGSLFMDCSFEQESKRCLYDPV